MENLSDVILRNSLEISSILNGKVIVPMMPAALAFVSLLRAEAQRDNGESRLLSPHYDNDRA